MPRHIEQPAPRHWAPASVKIRSSPSDSACSRTWAEPGTTSMVTCSAIRRPRRTSAATRRSSIRPLVQEPTKTVSIRDLPDRRAGCQVHVAQRALGGGPGGRVGELRRCRHAGADRHALARVGAPGDERGERADVDVHLAVEHRVRVGEQLLPVRQRGLPVGTLGRRRPTAQVVEGDLVRCHQAGPGTGLDGHVAHREPARHGHLPDHLAAVFHHVALAAAGADGGDHRQDHVLRADPWLQAAGQVDRHRLEAAHRQRLGGQYVLDLAGADAEGQRAQRTVRRGVRVAADDGHARLAQPELRADHVHDALLAIAERIEPDAEVGAVLAQGLQLQPGDRVGDQLQAATGDRGRGVVVLGGDGLIRPAHRPVGLPESLEGLWAGYLVYQVQIDVEQLGFSMPDEVRVPDLLGECLGHRSSLLVSNTETQFSPCAHCTLHRDAGPRHPPAAD